MSEGAYILSASGLAKTFGEGTKKIEVLRGVDIGVRRGETVSVRGESGSGKSTILNLLSGLDKPDSGTVMWQDRDISRMPNKEVARKRASLVGMIFQAYYLIPELNILENVLFSARILGKIGEKQRKRAQELLERVELGGRAKSPPMVLSGGEKQRVAVARALMNEPEVLLADEPTGNLDERTGGEVMRILMDVCRERNTAMILVTHNKDHAAKADRILYLEKGLFVDEHRAPPLVP